MPVERGVVHGTKSVLLAACILHPASYVKQSLDLFISFLFLDDMQLRKGGFFMNMKNRERLKFICFAALLVALEVVLNRFLSINTPGLKIGFSFVPIVVAAIVFGPLRAGVIYAVADLIGAMLFPIGPYFPGFTVCAFMMGTVYGAFLYKREKLGLLKNILPPIIINNIVFGLLVNTIWVSILYDSRSYWGWFLYRLPEYAVLVPISAILTPAIFKLTNELKKIVNK